MSEPAKVKIDLRPYWHELMEAARRFERVVKEDYRDHYRDWTGHNFHISIPGEYAVGLYLGELPNLKVRRRTPDGGVDLPINDVDAKSTEIMTSPCLLIPRHARHLVVPTRKYVLVTVKMAERCAYIRGFAYGHEILAKAPQVTDKPFRKGSTVLPLSKLHDVRTLKPEPAQRELFE